MPRSMDLTTRQGQIETCGTAAPVLALIVGSGDHHDKPRAFAIDVRQKAGFSWKIVVLTHCVVTEQVL
jgi:hypothetical protein